MNDEPKSNPPLDAAVAWAHRTANSFGLIRIRIQEALQSLDDRATLEKILRELAETLDEPSSSLPELMSLLRQAPNSSLPISINSLLTDLVSSKYSSSRKRRPMPKITLDLAPNIPQTSADPRLLREAFRNVIDNAIRAASEQPSESVTISSTSADGKIIVDIADSGHGIREDIQAVLFRSIVESQPGRHGSGLLISKRLLRSWGGDIELAHTDESGTTFRITLPIAPSIPARRMDAPAALVVEDDDIYRHYIRGLLDERGFRTDTSPTFGEAIRLLTAKVFDLVILDVHLNEHDAGTGIDLARVAREHSPRASVIVLSAYSDREFYRQALSAGVDAFLDKSTIDTEQLYFEIDRVASRRASERESLRQAELTEFTYQTVSMMSHELRSPLLSVQRNAEALAAGAYGPLSADQGDAVDQIRIAVQREFVLLNAHLDLTRLERGIEGLNYQERDLVALVHEEVAAHWPEANLRGVTLREVLPAAEAIVLIDANRFRVALNPLIDNAIKYSQSGQAVTITGTIRGPYVQFEIADDGPGMKHNEIELFLSPENRKAEFSQRMRTSGLGLSMSKRMIDLHGGNLWIESDGKSGTKVSFRLPIGASEER